MSLEKTDFYLSYISLLLLSKKLTGFCSFKDECFYFELSFITFAEQ
jgi:hypothetical protein